MIVYLSDIKATGSSVSLVGWGPCYYGMGNNRQQFLDNSILNLSLQIIYEPKFLHWGGQGLMDETPA